MNGIFITATDTGVGKTFVSAGIASALKNSGINTGIMKPVHTGCIIKKGRLIPEDTLYLMKAASVDDPIELVTPYMFREPVAPSVAAEISGTPIDIRKIIKAYKVLCRQHEYMIVEGIGGIMVPIIRYFYVADLIKKLGLPALIITRPDLGTINHTLLTINYMKNKNIQIKGIVINHAGKGGKTLAEKTCVETIEKYSEIPVIGIIPFISGNNPLNHKSFQRLSDTLLRPLL
ncbi:MAG: dethiobiotin synthase [Nitrospirae bacterium]|nr:dethiobiotin synthase [Nitrospirota bacterium]